MSANFNIVMFTKKKVDLNWLIRVVQDKGFIPTVTKIESVENWDFEDLQDHKCESDPEDINMLIEAGRITMIFGAVQSYLIISALGVEVVVDYTDDFNKTIHNSHNVLRWVSSLQENTGDLWGYKQVGAGIWDKEV